MSCWWMDCTNTSCLLELRTTPINYHCRTSIYSRHRYSSHSTQTFKQLSWLSWPRRVYSMILSQFLRERMRSMHSTISWPRTMSWAREKRRGWKRRSKPCTWDSSSTWSPETSPSNWGWLSRMSTWLTRDSRWTTRSHSSRPTHTTQAPWVLSTDNMSTRLMISSSSQVLEITSTRTASMTWRESKSSSTSRNRTRL